MQVSEVRVYPVKSCRGDAVESALVEPWGLAGDRRWMVVEGDDPEGAAVTAREAHRLLLVHPVATPTGLRLSAPGLPDLEVTEPRGDLPIPVQVHRHRLVATPTTALADAWFSQTVGRAVRLVWMDDPSQRPTNPAFSEPDDRVSLADGYPLLLTTEESLAALSAEIGAAGALEMVRFRPNVVVSGAPAWAEDDWRRIRLGEATFRAVKACDRCVMTTVDPDTAESGHEPIRTLARVRRYDGATWFGVNLVPDTPGARLSVGDGVEVLDAVAPGGGPLRPVRS